MALLHTEETKAKIRAKRALQILDDNWQSKHAAAMKIVGKARRKSPKLCKVCGAKIKRQSTYCRQHYVTPEFKEKIRQVMLTDYAMGKRVPIKGERRPKAQGLNHPWWRGGIREKGTLRQSSRNWQKARMRCLVRDNFICQSCGNEGFVAAHKDEPWDGESLEFTHEELITLCPRCHQKLDGRRRSIEYREKKKTRGRLPLEVS